MASTALAVVFGDVGRRAAGFTLEAAHPRRDLPVQFARGTSFVVLDGRRFDLREQNGVEVLALANLRDDLRQMVEHGRGGLEVRDHDDALVVGLWVEGDDVLPFATAGTDVPWSPNLPAELADEPLAPMRIDDLTDVVGVIDAAEARFGPLTGHCPACGTPRSTWPNIDPRRT